MALILEEGCRALLYSNSTEEPPKIVLVSIYAAKLWLFWLLLGS